MDMDIVEVKITHNGAQFIVQNMLTGDRDTAEYFDDALKIMNKMIEEAWLETREQNPHLA
jgi:hypothetical protein